MPGSRITAIEKKQIFGEFYFGAIRQIHQSFLPPKLLAIRYFLSVIMKVSLIIMEVQSCIVMYNNKLSAIYRCQLIVSVR